MPGFRVRQQPAVRQFDGALEPGRRISGCGWTWMMLTPSPQVQVDTVEQHQTPAFPAR